MTTGSTTTDPDARERDQAKTRIEAPTDARQGREVESPDTTSFASIWQLFGYAIVDADGTTAGPVARVWTDTASGKLGFIGLRTGRVRRQTHVIPARDARIDVQDRSIRVGYLTATMRNAPRHNTDVTLTADQARKVDTYYDNS